MGHVAPQRHRAQLRLECRAHGRGTVRQPHRGSRQQAILAGAQASLCPAPSPGTADVQLISVADKLYNARAILEDYREIGPTVWKRFKRGRNDQISYFDQLLAVYKSSAASRIVDELERVVNELRKISAKEA